MPKSWWVQKENFIKDGDSEEEIERKTLYSKLCASKKPYFFAYNYPHYKTEFDSYTKTNQENAVAVFKKTLDEMVDQYHANMITDENELKFVRNYLYYLPLDISKSTMNRICWAIEREFDGVNMFQDVDFDSEIFKSGIEYDQNTYEIVKMICQSYKPSVSLAKKRAACFDDDDDGSWVSADTILYKIIEDMRSQCNNDDELCDILVDLCYKERIDKQILWSACGNTIINRLLKAHNYQVSYPKKDENGDFWCQGVKYSMQTVYMNRGDIDED